MSRLRIAYSARRWRRAGCSGRRSPFCVGRRLETSLDDPGALRSDRGGRGRLCAASATGAWALGLGRLAVQSALGETLRAEIDITASRREEAASLRVRVAPPEAYRAAGRRLQRRAAWHPGHRAAPPRRPPFLRVTSDRVGAGAVRRRDPRAHLVDRPAGARIHAAVRSAGRTRSRHRPADGRWRTPRRRRRRAPPAPAPVAPAAPPLPRPRRAATAAARLRTGRRRPPPPTSAGADEYAVAAATRCRASPAHQRPGVSLDQMLVSLYRGNPRRLHRQQHEPAARRRACCGAHRRAGRRGSARPRRKQVIQAQSADFGAYRQRLAGGVPADQAERAGAPGRAARCRPRSRTASRRAAGSRDKLTLSQGRPCRHAPEAEQVSRQAETEGQRGHAWPSCRQNVEELKKLQGAAAGCRSRRGRRPARSRTGAPPAVAPAAKPAAGTRRRPPTPAARPPPAAVAPPPLRLRARRPPLGARAGRRSAAARPRSPPLPRRRPDQLPPACRRPPRPWHAAHRRAAPAGRRAERRSAALLDNPLAAAAAPALLVALLAGLGFYRCAAAGKDSGETSFLESRLQPDSFFGASGGQRIDTRDADRRVVVDELLAEPARRDRRRRSGGRGRRLPRLRPRPAGRGDPQGGDARQPRAPGDPHQAARGLCQAARHQGLRAAGHAALRADQRRRARTGPRRRSSAARSIPRTRCTSRAAARRRCRPRRRPRSVEPLGASTMPQSVLPTSRSGLPAAAATRAFERRARPSISTSTCARRARAPEPDEPRSRCRRAAAEAGEGLEFDLPIARRAQAAAAAAPAEHDAADFDLQRPVARSRRRQRRRSTCAATCADFGDLDLPADGGAGRRRDDPLARKLELAEEFRQIGDNEGARDLLEEVVGQGQRRAEGQGPEHARQPGLMPA